MLERVVEDGLSYLTARGFKCPKLTCPGTSGVPDRLILRPKWSPGAPWVLELKRPGKEARALQAAVHDDWKARGVQVLPVIDTPDKLRILCRWLLAQCEQATTKELPWIKQNELEVFDEFSREIGWDW